MDNLWFWSENHIVINLVIEYLAGQRFPDEVFTVTGLTGAEHMERAKPGILEWVRERGELGFFEWHSNVYMLKNITPLHLLAEQADDPELVQAAAMALDLCVLDLAAHTQAGCYTAPRGRTYKKDKMSSLDEDTFGTAKFLFDDTTADYQSRTDGGATFLAVGTRYRPPQLLIDIARRRPRERRARTSRRIPRHRRPARGRTGRAVRQRLRRPGQPAVLVEPRRPRVVADGAHRCRRGDRTPALGHRAVRAGQADGGDQRQRPGDRSGSGCTSSMRS